MPLYNKGLRPHDLDPQDASGNGITQLTGAVTAGPGSGSQAASITNKAVTYAKIQDVGASSLLGNPTGGAHATEEITLGTNLSFAGSVLNATGGSAGIEITDGTHDVTGATKLTITGGTVGGTTPDATLTISGGSGWTAALVNITSDNAAPTEVTLDLTVMAMRVGVTTDGSGLAQVVDIPGFTLTNGVNSAMNGYLISITTDVLADPSDVPSVTCSNNQGVGQIQLVDEQGALFGVVNGKAIPIDYAGATAILVWQDANWYWADKFFNNDAVIDLEAVGIGSPQILANLGTPLAAGARSFCTDATAPVVGQAVTGSGSVKVPVYWDGSNWIADAGVGATDTFVTADAKTVTVVNGIITSIA